MPALIESNPDICGGKPVVKGTRIPVGLVFELLGLNYSLDYILEQYPTLSRDALLQLVQIARDAQKTLIRADWSKILPQETPSS